MTDEVDREEAWAPVCCVEDPIVSNPQLEHASPLPSPEWFWRDIVEMRSEPPDPAENTIPDVRGKAIEIANSLRTDFDLVGGAHHLRPYFLATSFAGTPRSPRRLVCRVRRSRRSTVERRVRPLSGSLSISVNFRSTASSTTSRSSSTVIRATVFIRLRPPANRLAWATPLRAGPLSLGDVLPHAPQCCASITRGFLLRQGQTCMPGIVPPPLIAACPRPLSLLSS